jgi:lysophospholipase L1-like esterase
VLGPEVQAIGTALGSDVLRNVLNDEAPYVPADATLVTVFVGANDANVIEKAVESGSGGSDPGGYVDDQVQTFGTDLRAMIATVQGRAPKARLVALNLPNLAGVPYANGASLEKRHRLQQISVGLSSRIDALTTANVTVVDLMCDGAVYDPAHYSDDGFHPNDAGYTHIADLITAALAAGAPSLPAASCVYMTLY